MATVKERAVAAETEHEETHHPSIGQYIEIGVILAVLTAIEVGLYEAGERGLLIGVSIGAIIALTLAKFFLVVSWFMHLRFDAGVFRRIFSFGAVLATIVFTITIANMLGTSGNG